MRRTFAVMLVTCAFGVAVLFAQEGVQRGTIKKIDLDKKTLTLAQGGQEREYVLTEETIVPGVQGKDLGERLAKFKPGAEIMFKAQRREGKEVLIGLKLQSEPFTQADTLHLKPLTEIGKAKYQGYEGGLYPQGKNTRPSAHELAGLALAKRVRPLDPDGKPSADGKIVLLSVGMSNTSQSSQGFERALAGARKENRINPKLLFVNGAQGGMTAFAIQDPNDQRQGTKYWTEVDQRLKKAGVTPAQVQAIWIKQADAGPRQGFPKYAKQLESELARIVQILPVRFPNIKLVYLSSRTYGGYATTPLNPEPYAYESGFSVKWLIERQIQGEPALNYDAKKGPIKAPWLSWGPYLWANGTTKRADGFSYDRADFVEKDGTHQSPSGMTKVGLLLLDFFESDSTTRPWFLNVR